MEVIGRMIWILRCLNQFIVERKEGFMKATGKIVRIYSVCLVLMVILLGGVPFGAIAADTIKIGI